MKAKDQNTYTHETSGLQYTDHAFQDMARRHELRQSDVMRPVGHTNQTTYLRWLSGSDIYLRSLLTVLNAHGIDLLELIEYFGHKFQSHIEDLYRLELTGTTIADVLRERGIDPYSGSNSPISVERREAIDSKIKAESARRDELNTTNAESQLSMTGLIDRIVAIQNEAHHHETEALDSQRNDFLRQMEQLRRDMQAEMERQVSDRQQHINRLLMDNAQLREQLNAAQGIKTPHRSYPLVSDSNKPGG